MSVQKPSTTRAKTVYFIWNYLPRFTVLFLLLLIIGLSLAISGKKSDQEKMKQAAIAKGKPPVNVVTLTLNPTTIIDRINLPGSIEPWVELQLLAKIGGAVQEVLVREGETVSKGQLLALVEDNDYRIAVSRARAAYTLAKAEFERDQAIYKKGVIPLAEFDAKETAMQTTKADLDNAQLQLSRCQIISPMDGTIDILEAKVGLYLAIGDPVAEIIKMDKVKAVIGIPESDVSAVRTIETVDLIIQALGDKGVVGDNYFLSPVPRSIARLYDLELAVDNINGDILPGMFVRADIVKNTKEDAIVIPFYSVISRNDEQYVFVEQGGVVTKKGVTLGIMEKWMVEVVDGLAVGEHLVIEGHRDVEDQQRVTVVKHFTNASNLPL